MSKPKSKRRRSTAADPPGSFLHLLNEMLYRWTQPLSGKLPPAPGPPHTPPPASSPAYLDHQEFLLYRELIEAGRQQLARRYHPDIGANEADKAIRTETLTRLNTLVDKLVPRGMPRS
ncbi:hypothetical protein EPO44_10235 [bacterium]|nr:MAG: hypothetical protein EPO44_10235 [bacterium]